MSDRRFKSVNGISASSRGIRPALIDVRMTSDKRGTSLSLCDGSTMLQIPLEAVTDIIILAERK